MKILFVGNSYTYFNDMPKLLEALLKENGYDAEVASVTKGGRKLYENIDKNDETAQALKKEAAENDFDILFVQEQSLLPISDKEAFLRGVCKVTEAVAAKRTVLYATWGRKCGSEVLTERNLSSEEMTLLLNRAYDEAATAAGAEVSRVGLCFLEISKKLNGIELYTSDLSHPSFIGSCVAALAHYTTVIGEFPERFSSLGLDTGIIEEIKDNIIHTAKNN